MRCTWAWACILVALLACPGCFERTEKVTLNPDGSGKSELDLYVNIGLRANFNGRNQLPPALAARKMAMEIVSSAKGVDAWSDVSYQLDPNNWLHFKGTAYFKSLSGFDIPQVSLLKTTWSDGPGGGKVLSVERSDQINFPSPPESSPAPPTLTDDQLNEAVKQARAHWPDQKQAMAALYNRLKIDVTYLLPGQVAKSSTFKQVPGGVEVVIDAGKIMAGMDKLINDDAALKAAVKDGWREADGPTEDMMNRFLFDQKGRIVISANVGGELKPLFDYAQQEQAAAKTQRDMLTKAGLYDDSRDKPPPLDAPLEPQPIK